MGSTMRVLIAAAYAPLVAGVAACNGTTGGDADGVARLGPDTAMVDTTGTVHDSVVGLRFDVEAGDRQRLLKGTCPGSGCEVGPMVSVHPVYDSHRRGDTAEVLARIINEENLAWADSSLVLAPYDTVYVEIHAPSTTSCTARYRKASFYRGTMADSTLGVAPPGCEVQHPGKNWRRGLARWQVGSIAAWMSCNRGCCRAI